MSEEKNIQDAAANEAELQDREQKAEAIQEQANERPKLKRNNLKDDFKKKGEEHDKQNEPPMSKEDTIKFYEENLPFLRLQDEYEELMYRYHERRVRNIELQVREVEAIGTLSQWKSQQDEAKRRHESEEKMKAQWDAMTDEEKEDYKQKAKRAIAIMEMQAKGQIDYTGENARDIYEFVTGEPQPPVAVNEDLSFTFQCPKPDGSTIEMTILPGQNISRAMDGSFVITQPA